MAVEGEKNLEIADVIMGWVNKNVRPRGKQPRVNATK